MKHPYLGFPEAYTPAEVIRLENNYDLRQYAM